MAGEKRSGPAGGRIHYAACGKGGGPEPTIYALVSERGGWEPYCQAAHVSADGGRTWSDITDRVVAGAIHEEGNSLFCVEILRKAEDTENHGLALQAIGEARRNLDLIARLRGDLGPNSVINVALVQHPQWAALRDRIVGALLPFPLALQAVRAALDESDTPPRLARPVEAEQRQDA